MKKILIISPFLSNLGGTEIEAITMSILFYKSNHFEKVAIFSNEQLDDSLRESFMKDNAIDVKTFPKFYQSKYIKFIDVFFLKLGFKYKISHVLYVKFLINFYSCFFILSFPNSIVPNLFAESIPKRKKSVFKITMRYFDYIEPYALNNLRKVNKLLVFNKIQQKYFIDKYSFKNTVVSDVPILLEKEFLKLSPTRFDGKTIKFGYIGRIAEEKNLEDMIRLIEFLLKKGFSIELYIRGDGDYTQQVKNKILVSPAKKYIFFNNSKMLTVNTKKFYESIDVFLVTSHHEGGPITALEAAASGKMIFSYDVGAMAERFGAFRYIINEDFDSLCSSAVDFFLLTDEEKNNFVRIVRTHYLEKLSNVHKQNNIIDLFN